MRLVVFSLLLFFLGVVAVQANVTPSAIFSDHMVLQRLMPIVVWGKADANEDVTVELKGANFDKSASTVATDGNWRVQLPPLPAGGPYTMTISGQNKVEINDVLIGEVWLCSGQSNMEHLLGPRMGPPNTMDWEKEVAAANYPQIRQFHMNTPAEQATPSTVVDGSWTVCSPETAPDYTAVGYFFARDLQQKIHVPIGIINSSVGGTPIKAWTNRQAMLADPDLKKIAEPEDLAVGMKKWADDTAAYKAKEPALLDQYNKDAAAATAAGKPAPQKPQPPQGLFWNSLSGVLYNGKIAPLAPYRIRGAIWYQGESDSGPLAAHYEKNLQVLIADWRKIWGEGNFPFFIVQIAPCYNWDPVVREAELLTWQNTPNTAMVVTTDIGSTDPHPPNKQLVGERLSLDARALVYGEKTLEYSGPIYQSADFSGNQAIVHFTHLGGGLVAKDGDLTGFMLSADNKNFSPAKAQIQGDTVVVTSDQVPQPKFVRLGWEGVPKINLYNQAGLPASPFWSSPVF
jgi:sialate O-acetylesterase